MQKRATKDGEDMTPQQRLEYARARLTLAYYGRDQGEIRSWQQNVKDEEDRIKTEQPRL